MLRASFAAVLLAVAPIGANAEFLLQATQSAPTHAQRQLMPMAHRVALPVVHPATLKPVAPGFGRDVPLAFAVKQILPDGVQPQMAPTVDPDAKVTWVGDRPWDVVLSEAVKPLGIKLEATNTSAVLTR